VQVEQTERLVRLLTTHQDDLFRFIFCLLPHEEDARDVLQETSVALCRKFTEYDETKPFLNWAFGYAYLEVLKQRERNQRGNRLLRADVVQRLAAERESAAPELEARLAALEECLLELPERDAALIRQRYRGRARIEELLESFGTSRRTLFRNLERIRRVLHDCIDRRLALGRR
jgi:RNA polymerase sigma-70 factor (ECF subfamily)